MRRIGQLRVQIDRRPISTDRPTCYVLTVITVGLFAVKPDKATIVRALMDAELIVKETEC